MRKLTIIQTTIASYRTPVFNYLKTQLGSKVDFAAGDSFFDPTIKLDPNFKPLTHLNNTFIFSRKFLWQSNTLDFISKKGVVVMGLNPRVLSSWFILIMRKILRRPTVLWGHAWPQSGVNSKSDSLRHLMRLLSDKIIVYSKLQQNELKKLMPKKNIVVASNSLYFKKDMSSKRSPDPSDIIYVGRLVQNKKATLLYTAFKESLSKLPIESKLILIGDGPDRSSIIELTKRDGLEDRVILTGSINKVNLLKPYYENSLISVSPGRVGLGLIQSLGFGVPMIIAKNELHGPEIEAATTENAIFFEEDNVESLTKKIVTCFENKDSILKRREKISTFCKQNYSIETMMKTFENLVN